MVRYTLNHDGGALSPYVSVSLKAIDDFTTQFLSYPNLVSHLEKLGITGIKNLRINYKFNSHIGKLRVAYNDKRELQDITFTKNSVIDPNNSVFNKYFEKFIRELDKYEFYSFVRNSNMFSDKLIEDIGLYRLKKDYSSYYKVKNSLSTYAQFRKILFVFEEYEWYKIKLEVNEEYEEFRDVVQKKVNTTNLRDETGLDDEFLTDEEIEEYKKYIDEQPENEHPHYNR